MFLTRRLIFSATIHRVFAPRMVMVRKQSKNQILQIRRSNWYNVRVSQAVFLKTMNSSYHAKNNIKWMTLKKNVSLTLCDVITLKCSLIMDTELIETQAWSLININYWERCNVPLLTNSHLHTKFNSLLISQRLLRLYKVGLLYHISVILVLQ